MPITDTLGNIVAEINANGNNLGLVTTSLFVNNGTIREQAGDRALYLDRNITITPATQPITPISLRLYISSAEFNALKSGTNSAGQGSGVLVIGDLSIYKNSNGCGAAMSGTAARQTTTNQAAFGPNGYVLQTSIASFSTFYIANVSSLLPVHLLSFSGALVNGMAQLVWATENETGTKQFTIERSTDGRNFTPIAGMPGIITTGTQAYGFVDSAIAELGLKTVYYRLKTTAVDGASGYSHVVQINLNKMGSAVSVYPNPVINDATIEINSMAAEQTSWQLTDITGKTILQRSFALNKGSNAITLHLSAVPAGSYYLKITGNSTKQFVKLQKL